MAFEDIELINAPKPVTPKVPVMGVAVAARRLGTRKGGEIRYIKLQIGAQLAKAISLVQPACNVRLLFGTGPDAGMVQVSVDNAAGKFAAKRQKSGAYALTINAATADGLFALNFPAFAHDRIEAIRPDNGKPPHFVFRASDQMLAAD